jgi:hypothetical protein
MARCAVRGDCIAAVKRGQQKLLRFWRSVGTVADVLTPPAAEHPQRSHQTWYASHAPPSCMAERHAINSATSGRVYQLRQLYRQVCSSRWGLYSTARVAVWVVFWLVPAPMQGEAAQLLLACLKGCRSCQPTCQSSKG